MAFRKRSSAGAGPADGVVKQPSASELSETYNEEAQELMRNNLELMKEVVMRIREDPDFAANIYANCPRLQYHLDLHPDLRPIFEDPMLVRINFEQVYREAGGTLPEDEEEDSRKTMLKKALVMIVHSRLFKILRVLLLVKKIVNCATGGFISSIRGCFTNLFCHGAVTAPPPPDLDNVDGADVDGQPNAANLANQEALNRAADHMSDPAVQEHMNDLLQNDPEGLQDAINNDPELSTLRDSNPLCAQLMSDPDTMKILVDPDNLRALGDCPDLVQQDFIDPNWTPPDVEMGGLDPSGVTSNGLDMMNPNTDMINAVDPTDLGVDPTDLDVNGDPTGPVDLDMDVETDPDGNLDGTSGPVDLDADVDSVGDPDDAADGDYDVEDPTNQQGGNNFASQYLSSNNQGPSASGAKSKGRQRTKQGGNEGGFMSQVTSGFTDLVAGQIVGATLGQFMPGGNDFPLDHVADQAGSSADALSSAADNANAAVQAAQTVSNSNQLSYLETGMDKLESVNDSLNGAEVVGRGSEAGAIASGGAVGGMFLVGNGAPASRGQVIQEGEEEDGDEPEEKGRFGWLGDIVDAVKEATKQTVAGAVFGQDLGEYLLDKEQEKEGEEEEGKEGAQKKGDGHKKGGLFSRGDR